MTKGPDRLAVCFASDSQSQGDHPSRTSLHYFQIYWWSGSIPAPQFLFSRTVGLLVVLGSSCVLLWDLIVPHPHPAPRHGSLTLMVRMDSGTHYGGWCPWKMCNLVTKSRRRALAAFTQGPGFIRCLPLSRHPHHHMCSSCKRIPLT